MKFLKKRDYIFHSNKEKDVGQIPRGNRDKVCAINLGLGLLET